MARERTRSTGVAAAALFSLASCTVYDDSLLTRASFSQRPDDAGESDAAASATDADDAAPDAAGGGERRDAPARAMQSDGAESCSDCCTEQRIAGNSYYFCTHANTWAKARERCKAEFGAGLARIADKTQARLLAEQASARVWIGHHVQRDSLWVWSDNAVPFWHGDAAGKPVFGRSGDWADGQPETGKQCGELTVDAKLGSDDCSDEKPYICQKYPDACPDDDAKTDPGQCGCGVADVDRDEDGVAACNDACEDDADKPLESICDCEAGQDDDGDGTVNCNDGCPTDPQKTAAGACGCGKPDSDADRDGVADCQDRCPSDAQKQTPGQCGCGTADSDQDRDGTPDCKDACPHDGSTTGNCFPFTPSNLDQKLLDFTNAPASQLNCGDTILDTSPSPARFTNWCGAAPRPVVRKLSNGPEVVVIALRSLEVASNNTLHLVGSRPVVFAVRGDVAVAGVIDASANGATPGAGGNWSCGGSQGGAGQGRSGEEGGGGGGGGFVTAGGQGGDDTGDGAPGAGGVVRTGAANNLVPLVAGCGGGAAGGCAGAPGAGGGAVQITASGRLAVTGTIRANGGNGADNCDNDAGGQGGGSGGAILLESSATTRTGALTANGGSGGSGDRGNPGQGATSSNANGREGNNGLGHGGGGGGGGYGRVVVR